MEALYIADGHHRTAATCQYAEQQSRGRRRLAPHSKFLMAYLFPESHLRVISFNRLVRTVAPLTNEAYLAAIRNRFHINVCNPFSNLGSLVLPPDEDQQRQRHQLMNNCIRPACISPEKVISTEFTDSKFVMGPPSSPKPRSRATSRASELNGSGGSGGVVVESLINYPSSPGKSRSRSTSAPEYLKAEAVSTPTPTPRGIWANPNAAAASEEFSLSNQAAVVSPTRSRSHSLSASLDILDQGCDSTVSVGVSVGGITAAVSIASLCEYESEFESPMEGVVVTSSGGIEVTKEYSAPIPRRMHSLTASNTPFASLTTSHYNYCDNGETVLDYQPTMVHSLKPPELCAYSVQGLVFPPKFESTSSSSSLLLSCERLPLPPSHMDTSATTKISIQQHLFSDCQAPSTPQPQPPLLLDSCSSNSHTGLMSESDSPRVGIRARSSSQSSATSSISVSSSTAGSGSTSSCASTIPVLTHTSAPSQTLDAMHALYPAISTISTPPNADSQLSVIRRNIGSNSPATRRECNNRGYQSPTSSTLTSVVSYPSSMSASSALFPDASSSSTRMLNNETHDPHDIHHGNKDKDDEIGTSEELPAEEFIAGDSDDMMMENVINAQLHDQLHMLMYFDGKWFELSPNDETLADILAVSDNPVDTLGVQILVTQLLAPILGITNPSTDQRMIYGTKIYIYNFFHFHFHFFHF